MEQFNDSFKSPSLHELETCVLNSSKSQTDTENENRIIQEILEQLDNPVEEPANQFNTRAKIDDNVIPQSSCSIEQSVSFQEVTLQDPPNVEEILSVDEALIKPSSHNVTVINSACQEILKQMEFQLLTLLKKNRKEQDVIQNFLSSSNRNIYSDVVKKTSVKCAGFPYFKDSFGFQAPPNEDVLRKERKKKLVPLDFIKSFPVWNSADSTELVNSVHKYDVMKPENIDWMKISATDFDGKYSPAECKAKWMQHMNPKTNKSKWTVKEMELLKNVSAKYCYQDWDAIAAELGTGRTGLQCCIQYHTRTFPTEGKWTKEEDKELINLVDKYKVKDYIPWGKVVWHFEHRSMKQCQERYAYHLGNIKRGTFSMEEDFVLVYLASKLKNFGEVAKFLPNRVATQLRSRYEYLVKVSMPEFTQEEDELLTKLMVQYPRNWTKISQHFLNRSRVQCRKRWAHLQKKIDIKDEVHHESESDEEKDCTPNNNRLVPEQCKNDAVHVKNKIHQISERGVGVKRYPEPYKKLIEYHKYCYKFLFGPKPRLPATEEDLNSLTSKLTATMKILSVNHAGPLPNFHIDSLTENVEFNEEDFTVLNALHKNPYSGFEISKRIIPPNYMTLLALRTFTIGWNEIKNLSNFYEDEDISRESSSDRILFSDAKKLFKSRMKSIFAFPIILSNIERKDECPGYKAKVRKAVKPLSKRKRREHARMMSQAYRNKIKEFCKDFDDEEAEDVVNAISRKRKRKANPENPNKLAKGRVMGAEDEDMET